MSALERLSESLWLGVVLLDANADVAFANDAARTLLGCACADELSGRWRALMSQLGVSRASLSKAAAPLHVRAELKAAEGARRLDVEALQLEQEPHGGWLLLLREVGTLDPLEGELVLASRMRAQKYYLAALAHDLADATNALGIALEGLKSHHGEGAHAQPAGRLAAQRDDYLGALDAELAHLKRAVQALSGHEEDRCSGPESVELSGTIERCLRILQQPARLRHIELRHSLHEATTSVLGRAPQMRQALLNVLTYAIDSMPEGGQLRVETLGAEGSVEVLLCADGLTVGAELSGALHRVDGLMRSIALDPRLYLARRLAEANGGALLIVARQPAEGACFRLRFLSAAPSR